MMNIYSAKWKRKGLLSLWKKEKNLIGHQYNSDQRKMIFFYHDGSVKEVCDWSKCEIRLGVDWVAFTKCQMEKEAGQGIQMSTSP